MRRRLGHNEALVADLCALFVDIHAAQLAAVQRAVEAADPDAVRRSAHMLKSGAANLSAGALVAAAGALERAAEQRDAAAFEPLFAAVAIEVAHLVAELRGFGRGSL
jgi:HPt (histidine-containing phosphotransfer) domain-containing protein